MNIDYRINGKKMGHVSIREIFRYQINDKETIKMIAEDAARKYLSMTASNGQKWPVNVTLYNNDIYLATVSVFMEMRPKLTGKIKRIGHRQ